MSSIKPHHDDAAIDNILIELSCGLVSNLRKYKKRAPGSVSHKAHNHKSFHNKFFFRLNELNDEKQEITRCFNTK